MTYKSVLRLLHTRPILSQRQPRTSKLNRRLSNPRLIWKQGVVSIKYCLVLLNPRLPLWSRLRFWCTMSLRRVSKPSLVLTRHGLGYTVTLAIVTGICFTNKTHKLVPLLFLQGLLLLQATERQPSNFCLQNFHQFITYKPRFELLIIKLSPELLHILPKVIHPNGIHGTMVHWPSQHAARVNLQALKSPWSSREVEPWHARLLWRHACARWSKPCRCLQG